MPKFKFKPIAALFSLLLVLGIIAGIFFAGDILAQGGSAVQLAPIINQPSSVGQDVPTNEVFYDQTVTVNYDGGAICLSSRSDQCSPPAIDDAVRIFVNGTEVYYHESYTSDFGPVEFSAHLLSSFNNQVRVQLIDLMGPTRGGSALYLFSSGWSSCADVTEIPRAECDALTTIYQNTNGPNWLPYYNWMSNNAPCSWYGIQCGSGHVITMSLSYGNLSGNIPTELSNLSELQSLRLSSNQLTGNIPPELDRLQKLQTLSLADNQLSGNIPTELSNLSELRYLYLDGNQLAGNIPVQLSLLTKLQDLNLARNLLDGTIPLELTNMPNLQYLDLGNNQLTGVIPPQLSNLSNLKEVWLNDNQLTGTIPPELGNLTQLTDLQIYNNQLTGTIPPQLGNLTNLWFLDLGGNNLTGTIPPELSNLSELTALWLYRNNLSGGIPAWIGNLNYLEWIEIHNNQFSGPLPTSLTNLTNLETFYYINTNLCEPPDPGFQSWLSGINYVWPTGVTCATTTYAISGRVTDVSGNGISSVIISDGAGHSATTDSNGYYTLSGLAGGTYTLTPSKSSYTFSPASRSVSVPPDASGVTFVGDATSPPPPSSNKPVVILVHGCCGGNGDTFENIPESLAQDGYPVYVIDDPDGFVRYYDPGFTVPSSPSKPVGLTGVDKLLPGDEPIVVSADNLKLMIDDAKRKAKRAEDEKIILVAHSKGGLISRIYLESYLYRNDVSKVIMLGTPNLGSPWGNINPKCISVFESVDLVEYELCELTLEAMGGFNNQYTVRAPNVEYYLVAGDLSPFDNKGIDGDNGDDWIVGVSSVHGLGGKNVNRYVRPGAAHVDLTIKGVGIKGYFTQAGAYSECIKPLVDGSPSHCYSDEYIDIGSVINTAETTTDYQQAGKWVGNVLPSQAITQEFRIDSNGHNNFQLLWSEEELSLTLVDPVGSLVTPAVVDTNPNIFYFTTPITNGVMYATAQYQITSTTPGLWTAVVTGSNINTKPVTFTVVAYTESQLTLNLSTDKENYSPGDTANIVATLTNGTTGLDGATLTAKIWRSDGTIDTLNLLPDGSQAGKYNAIYNQTSTSGYYYIEVQATGIANGTPFVRSTQKQFVVNSNNASLTGSYADTPKDDDGNSYYESLEISVGVNVAVAGDYSIAVLLKDKDGEVIANQVVNTSLVTGVNQVTVPFDGQIIRDHGVDGPYLVANVRAVDNSTIMLLSDSAIDVYTTVAYNHTQFGAGTGSNNIYLPLIVK